MLRFLTILLFAVVAFNCGAQDFPVAGDTTKLWRIETDDDNEFVGRVIKHEGGILTLSTEKFGTIQIKVEDIRSIEEADPNKLIGDNYWADNFQSTRYFWMPNGYGLKKGEAYYQNVWVFFIQFSVGITKNISVGVGTIPVFLLGGETVPFWITPKISLPISNRVSLGAGVLYLRVWNFNYPGDGSSQGTGVAYGVLTFGSRDKNASLGVGYGFSGRDFSKRPVVSFASMTRIGQRSYFMTESYLFVLAGETLGLVSVGGRRLIKNVGLDFGGFVPVGEGIDKPILIPWLGISMPLGKRQYAN
jgi:hypothetical protein